MEDQQQPRQEPKKSGFRNFISLGEAGRYFFRKKDPNRPDNVNIRIMHGINRLAIIIFLLGIIYIVVKRLFL